MVVRWYTSHSRLALGTGFLLLSAHGVCPCSRCFPPFTLVSSAFLVASPYQQPQPPMHHPLTHPPAVRPPSKQGRAVCPSTKSPAHMATMKLPYACKLLFQELQAMNIVPRLTLAEA